MNIHGNKDQIEGELLRERPSITQSYHDESGSEDNHAAKGYLQESEIFRLETEPKRAIEEIPEGLHNKEIASPAELARS